MPAEPTAFITKAPHDVAAWAALFDHATLPILASTAQALEELRAVVRASRLSFGVQRVRHAALFERLI